MKRRQNEGLEIQEARGGYNIGLRGARFLSFISDKSKRLYAQPEAYQKGASA